MRLQSATPVWPAPRPAEPWPGRRDGGSTLDHAALLPDRPCLGRSHDIKLGRVELLLPQRKVGVAAIRMTRSPGKQKRFGCLQQLRRLLRLAGGIVERGNFLADNQRRGCRRAGLSKARSNIAVCGGHVAAEHPQT